MGLFHQDRRLLDFRIFWCGGRVAVDGGDPDTVGQLPVCEHQHATPFMHASPNLVMPFVLPPFDLVPFDLFARLPYRAARIVYAMLCTAAVGGAIVLVAKSTQVPLPVPFELVALAATGWR